MLKEHRFYTLLSGDTLFQSPHALFRYELQGLTNGHAKIVGQSYKSKSKDKDSGFVEKITECGGEFKFIEVRSKVFERNLRRVDTLLPEIVAEILVEAFSQGGSSFDCLASHLTKSSHLFSQFGFTLERQYCELKLMQLLQAFALGLQTSDLWKGNIWAERTYRVVLSSGHELFYNIFNQRMFLNYLFENGRLEVPVDKNTSYPKIIIDGDKV